MAQIECINFQHNNEPKKKNKHFLSKKKTLCWFSMRFVSWKKIKKIDRFTEKKTTKEIPSIWTIKTIISMHQQQCWYMADQHCWSIGLGFNPNDLIFFNAFKNQILIYSKILCNYQKKRTHIHNTHSESERT